MCIVDFLLDVETCLPNEQRASKSTVEMIVDELLQFTCENEGDHIARKLRKNVSKIVTFKTFHLQICIIISYSISVTLFIRIRFYQLIQSGTRLRDFESNSRFLTVFISEKGPECIESKALQIQQCIKVGLNQNRSNETSMGEMGNTIDTQIWTDEAEERFSVDFNFENCK